MSGALSLQTSYYEALKRLTLELAGVKLGDNHAFLVETRLSALARREGFESLTEMISELFSRGQTRLAVNVVSSLIERDMRFFHDRAGFVQLEEKIIPRLLAAYKGRQIKILSFGCGTGQDVLSAAFMLDKLSESLPELDFHVTGVDYPSHALSRAQEGRYTHFEVQRGLPARDLVKYFKSVGEDWELNEHIRDKIEYKDVHLLSNIEPLGVFQIVMFRNSLIRHSAPAQVRILRSLAPAVVDHGYLMLGTNETLNDLNFGFEFCDDSAGFYKKLDAAVISNNEDARMDAEDEAGNHAPEKAVS